ncbi:Pro-kumamolisin [Colletotrichum cereale]|nr:Pro-kumamolisin [Colletotrichum cereale]
MLLSLSSHFTATVVCWCIALLASCIPGVSASFTQTSIKERHEVPRGWSPIARAPRHHRMSLHIGLQPQSPGQLERHLDDISDPFHPRFRRYLSADQVRDLMRPSEETLSAVHDWLIDGGISARSFDFSPGKDWIVIPDVTVAAAEKLLQTSYHEYRNVDGEALVRAAEWSLPLHLHDKIEMIHPTTSFLVTKSPREWPRSNNKVNASTPSSLNDAAEAVDDGVAAGDSIDLSNPPLDLTPEQACNTSAVSPICLRVLYGTLGYKAQVPDTNSMALSNYWGEFNNGSDIRRYLETYRPEAADGADNFAIVNFDGAVNHQEPATDSQLTNRQGREGNLDAQVMLGIGYPTRLVTYSTGGPLPPYNPEPSFPENTNEPFLAWLQHVLAQPDLPGVISTSYADTEYTVPPSYARRACNGFAQLGARGVTVVFGSGDWGVGAPETCHEPNGTAPRFVARFPESCPYGTSVGATRGVNPQMVAYNDRNGFVSGGGFSEYFSRPRYQDDAIPSYIARLDGMHDGLYNPHGRAYPDVAAMGYRILTVWNGTTRVVDGTSASAPIFAAVVALVNDALVAQGQPTLGFLNPWLYAGDGAKAFRDVTVGSARGCDTDGFPATEGWDAASGFGTPWFPDFKHYALQWGFRSSRPWYMD